MRLHEDGLIYRGKRLVNWDTKLHTAISDLEVENHDEKGFLWNLKYPLADGAKTAEGNPFLIVATTRPETMLGDSAVAVNPNDERYKALIGKFVELPLVGRRIPIIADDYCDPEFGTGCVKITPAHDFNDYEVGKRHNLPLLNIFDKNAHVLPAVQAFNLDGTLNETIDGKIPAEYAGLDRFEARKQIVAAFEAAGLLVSVDDHALKVPKGDRSGTIIEPWLTDQWYVSTKPLAEPAIAAVEDGRIQFVPKQYENMYFSWMRDIQDWCISRQLWWGHRIPAWYDESGKVYVGRDEAEVRAKHNLGPGRRAATGQRRTRHLVQLGPVDLLHARLAGTDRIPEEIPLHRRPGHRLRHHFLLGCPDDHAHHALGEERRRHAAGAVQDRVRARPGA